MAYRRILNAFVILLFVAAALFAGALHDHTGGLEHHDCPACLWQAQAVITPVVPVLVAEPVRLVSVVSAPDVAVGPVVLFAPTASRAPPGLV